MGGCIPRVPLPLLLPSLKPGCRDYPRRASPAGAVGTDNEQLLTDVCYVGNRHARRRGAVYDEFIRRYVETPHRLFPYAILHFEDFGPANARVILDKYSPNYSVF